MGYKKIGDYGIVGNGLSIALVGKDGSIDWMCLPYMDSPSVFAAVLDDNKGGRFAIQPSESWDSAQRYLRRTNILETTFRTLTGKVELTDFMPAGPEADQDEENRIRLLRRVRGLDGDVHLSIEFSPRFDYGRKIPEWTEKSANQWSIRAKNYEITLFSTKQLRWQNEQVTLEIKQGETIWLGLNYGTIDKQPLEFQLEMLLLKEAAR